MYSGVILSLAPVYSVCERAPFFHTLYFVASLLRIDTDFFSIWFYFVGTYKTQFDNLLDSCNVFSLTLYMDDPYCLVLPEII